MLEVEGPVSAEVGVLDPATIVRRRVRFWEEGWEGGVVRVLSEGGEAGAEWEGRVGGMGEGK